MADYIDAGGLTSTTYRLAFRTARALSIETIIVAMVLCLQAYLMGNRQASVNLLIDVSSIIADILIAVILVPYAIGVFRLILGLPLNSYLSRFRDLAQNRELLILTVGVSSIDLLIKEMAIKNLQTHWSIFAIALLMTFWLKLRLCVMEPALALECLCVTAKEAYRVTAGRIWELTFIGICVVVPLFVVISLLSLALLLIFHGLRTLWPTLSMPHPSPISVAIVTAFLSTFGLLLRSVLEAELFRRLFLIPVPTDER